jgi:hypothetical protein
MVARMKSRVLVREEKAIGTVTMKRIMICGMGAGIAYYVAQFLMPICSLPTLIVMFVIMLYATGDRYGVARYRWLLDGWHGKLLLQAYRHRNGITAKMCVAFDWDVSVVIARGDKLYAVDNRPDDDWSGIQILETDDPDAGGLEMVSDDTIIVEGT